MCDYVIAQDIIGHVFYRRHMTSPSIRTFQMKADELNYMPVKLHGHALTILGFRGHSFHPYMASKKLKSKKPSKSESRAEHGTLKKLIYHPFSIRDSFSFIILPRRNPTFSYI